MARDRADRAAMAFCKHSSGAADVPTEAEGALVRTGLLGT
jgi:hypothetical protein